MTRAMLATVLHNLEGNPPHGAGSAFPDSAGRETSVLVTPSGISGAITTVALPLSTAWLTISRPISPVTVETAVLPVTTASGTAVVTVVLFVSSLVLTLTR